MSLNRRLLKGAFGVENAGAVWKLAPGVALAAGVMLAALVLSDILGRQLLILQHIDPTGRASPVSGVLVAILLGIAIRNTLPLPDGVKAGVRFSVSKLLRLGIICVGVKLSIVDVLKLGAWGIPIVVTAIASGLLFVTWFNRLLKLPDRLGTLIAVGTGICGVTAIVSTAPAIDADEREVAYAVANVTLFGMLGMLIYPYVAHVLRLTSEQAGLFLGTAVHDTSQVVGAALAYKEVYRDEIAFQAATVTKLTRNLFLALVVPLMTFLYLRRQKTGGEASGREGSKIRIAKLFPLFVLGFVAMAVLRSIGDAMLPGGAALGLWDAAAWRRVTTEIGEVWGSRYLLGTAMASVGLGTSFSVFRGVGLKPFAVGFVGAILVGVVGLSLALLLGPYIKL